MSKLVISAIGPASSVQDGGRHGAQRYGLTPSGAMDRLALAAANCLVGNAPFTAAIEIGPFGAAFAARKGAPNGRSEEHTSELQSLRHLVCRLLLEKKKKKKIEQN